MTYEIILGCPKCGTYRAKSTKNICHIQFKCFNCGFTTIRKFKDRYGNYNFKLGQRLKDETQAECVARLNKGNIK